MSGRAIWRRADNTPGHGDDILSRRQL